jgi:thymidylate synthase (FAD)
MKIEVNTYGFSCEIIDSTENPNTAVYLGMHQCYSGNIVAGTDLTEQRCGEIIVDRLLKGNRGHYSPFEHAKITLALGGINHGTLQQLLRSRIGVSPSVQSFRYTTENILSSDRDIEDIIYLRPIGAYESRDGGKYPYTENTRISDLEYAEKCLEHVRKRINEGMPDEQARGLLPFDYRQNMIVSFNARSLMGFFDRRLKKDAQKEIRVVTSMIYECFAQWMPEVCEWYDKNRREKAILAP